LQYFSISGFTQPTTDSCCQKVKELIKKKASADQILFLYSRSKIFALLRERFKKEKIQVNRITRCQRFGE